MDQVTINGVEYTIDLASKKITWKIGFMNYEISMFEFIFNIAIARATVTFSSTITNYDLLVTAVGLTAEQAEEQSYVTPGPYKGQAYFTPDTLDNPSLTANDLMRWVNAVMLICFNYEPYERLEGADDFTLKP